MTIVLLDFADKIESLQQDGYSLIIYKFEQERQCLAIIYEPYFLAASADQKMTLKEFINSYKSYKKENSIWID